VLPNKSPATAAGNTMTTFLRQKNAVSHNTGTLSTPVRSLMLVNNAK
jgi:hypothetical protein